MPRPTTSATSDDRVSEITVAVPPPAPTTATDNIHVAVDGEQPQNTNLMGTRRVSAARTVASWRLFKKRDSEDEGDPLSAVDAAELATVIRLQRAFRFNMLLYSRMGASLFHRKDGSPSDHGTLTFGTLASLRKPAPFLTVSDEVDSLGLLRFLEKFWRLPAPELIISVTGGAQDFALSPPLLAMFNRGLSAAATSTKARRPWHRIAWHCAAASPCATDATRCCVLRRRGC